MKTLQIIAVLIFLSSAAPAGGGGVPVDMMEDVRRGWYCDAYLCHFDGLPYAVPVDRRFEHDHRKN